MVKVSKLGEVAERFDKSRINEICFERIKTGFDNLDTMLGGGIAPGLTIIGAISNLGKSTFVLQIAENIAKTGRPVLFFSMEMTATRIASKAISRQIFLQSEKKNIDSSISADSLLSKESINRIPDSMWDKIKMASEQTSKDGENLYIIEGGAKMNSCRQIYRYVRDFINMQEQEAAENGTQVIKPVVMIDYLQILHSDVTGGARAEIDDNIRVLKELTTVGENAIDKLVARDSNEKNSICDNAVQNNQNAEIPVIVISSIGRQFYERRMSLDAFKESGSIEYSADVVLGMEFTNVEKKGKDFDMNKEKQKFPRNVSVVSLKQRYGMCGVSADFDYYAKFDCFIEKESPVGYEEPVIEKVVTTKKPVQKVL